MSGDRIENGHEQSSPVGTRLTPRLLLGSDSLVIVVTRGLLHQDAHIPKAGEAREEHLACSMGEADPLSRISKAMVAAVWLTTREKKPRPAEHRTGFWVV